MPCCVASLACSLALISVGGGKKEPGIVCFDTTHRRPYCSIAHFAPSFLACYQLVSSRHCPVARGYMNRFRG